MGTRGIIGRPRGDGFEGSYNNSDSYPTWLGKTLFEEVYHGDYFNQDLDHIYRVLIDEHHAWSNISGVDWTKPPGFGGDGPECYCHGDRQEKSTLFVCTCPDFKSQCDGLSTEWAYVLTEPGIAIYAHVRTDRVHHRSFKRPDGERVRFDSPHYQHVFSEFVPWDSDPDWAAIEARGDALVVPSAA